WRDYTPSAARAGAVPDVVVRLADAALADVRVADADGFERLVQHERDGAAGLEQEVGRPVVAEVGNAGNRHLVLRGGHEFDVVQWPWLPDVIVVPLDADMAVLDRLGDELPRERCRGAEDHADRVGDVGDATERHIE